MEILSSHNQHPQPEWIDYVTTAKARSRLRTYFKKEERKYIQEGEELFVSELERLGMTDQAEGYLQRIMNHYQLKQPAQFFLQVGKHIIELNDMEKIVRPKQQSSWLRYLSNIPFISSDNSKADNTPDKEQQKKKGKHILLSEDNLGKEYRLADCCHPIPGDEVLGYKADDGIVIIHKRQCPEADKLKSSHGNRLYSAEWNMHRLNTFIATLEIKGIDKVGVIIKLLNIISEDFKANIHDLHVTAQDGIFNGTLQLYVYDTQELQDISNAIRKIKEINSIQRID